MSSFIGHTLIATAIARVGAKSAVGPGRRSIAWLVWLVVVASFPDIDYAVPWLGKAAHGGVRITHSPAFALVLPALTVAGLFAFGVRSGRLAILSLHVAAAGLSHLCLDFLVGVTPQALLWPIADRGFASPLGLLPSAGTPNPRNIYFYRNLAIELGVLLPLLACLHLGWPRTRAGIAVTVALLACAALCMAIAATLSR